MATQEVKLAGTISPCRGRGTFACCCSCWTWSSRGWSSAGGSSAQPSTGASCAPCPLSQCQCWGGCAPAAAWHDQTLPPAAEPPPHPLSLGTATSPCPQVAPTSWEGRGMLWSPSMQESTCQTLWRAHPWGRHVPKTGAAKQKLIKARLWEHHPVTLLVQSPSFRGLPWGMHLS